MAVTLTEQQCVDALREVLKVLDVPENKAKIDAAMQAAGGDLMKLMMQLMPVVLEFLGPQMTALGLPANQQGVMLFMGQLNMHQGNEEIKAGKDRIAGLIMPK